ncbi:unnamed protein product [Brugia pahangi]|uniref:Uncharacterized protein n=1 Tax=Brugia pahangi TaxID=6280 RepID=A0A0N4T1Z9_BRUPA|nr:unnamed protein product [Brugia pahangi]
MNLGIKSSLLENRLSCSDVRVVKELDLKSSGLCPRRFEPCSLRPTILHRWSVKSFETMLWLLYRNFNSQ